MASTITFTPKGADEQVTVQDLNNLFSSINAVLSNKVSLTDGSLFDGTSLLQFGKGGGIINIKTQEPNDLLRQE